MFKIAIDPGYGYFKGVSQNGKFMLIRSVVGTGHERLLAQEFGSKDKNVNQHVYIKMNGTEKEYFIGDLACQESRDASFAFDKNKIDHPTTLVLIGAVAAMLIADNTEPIHLVTGPPLKYIKSQKAAFEQVLNNYRATVRFAGDSREYHVAFDKVTIFPQGAAAVFQLFSLSPELAEPGSIIVMGEIGYKTTEVLMVEVGDNNQVRPVDEYSTTIETGMHLLEKAIDDVFFDETGARLNIPMLNRALSRQKIFYNGRTIDLKPVVEKARQEIARVIIDSIKAHLGDMLGFCRCLAFAGGGAEEIRQYIELIPNALVVSDPQYANALGGLEIIKRKELTEARAEVKVHQFPSNKVASIIETARKTASL